MKEKVEKVKQENEGLSIQLESAKRDATEKIRIMSEKTMVLEQVQRDR